MWKFIQTENELFSKYQLNITIIVWLKKKIVCAMFLQNFNDIRDVTVRATVGTSVTPKFPDPLNLFHGWGGG